MSTVILSELTWPQLKHDLESGRVDTAIITIGATEQHGYHLPLGTDSLLAQGIGETLARQLGRALLAPPITVGRSDHHMAFPGTITLAQEALEALLRGYVASLLKHGFGNIVLVPTHGGNFRPVALVAGTLRGEFPGANIVDYTDLSSFLDVLYSASGEFGVGPEAAGAHSGESETSMILALRPDLVRMEDARAGYLGSQEELASQVFARGIGALDPGGVLGDPRSATAERGRVYLRRIVDHLVEVITPQLQPRGAGE